MRRRPNSLQGPLIVSTETKQHPYDFVDENGELSGGVGDPDFKTIAKPILLRDLADHLRDLVTPT